MGHTKNPDIRIAKSVVDYIFRWLGITFLPGYREANLGLNEEPGDKAAAAKGAAASTVTATSTATATKPAAKSASAKLSAPSTGSNGSANGTSNGASKVEINLDRLAKAGVSMKLETSAGFTNRGEQFASFQTDAPSCDNCGAITVRNGNCYLCHNCGNSMGCS